MTGDAAAEARLTGQLTRNGLTSEGIETVGPGELGMNSKRTLYTIPVPSTSLRSEAYLDGRTPAIRFGYREGGVERQGGIKFSRVAAMRKRAERACTAWHIEGAYDTLVEVEGSWVQV